MKTPVIVTLLLFAPISSAVAEDAPPAKTAPAQDARFVPALRDGKPYGIKVYAIKPGSRYAIAGLRNGDTLITVDGQSVNDTASEQAFREVIIEGTRTGKVELDRQNKRLEITMEAVQKK